MNLTIDLTNQQKSKNSRLFLIYQEFEDASLDLLKSNQKTRFCLNYKYSSFQLRVTNDFKCFLFKTEDFKYFEIFSRKWLYATQNMPDTEVVFPQVESAVKEIPKQSNNQSGKSSKKKNKRR